MTILITGASRGIGAAVAASLTKAGNQVLMVSRNVSSLSKVAGQCNREAGRELAHAIPFDLTDLPDLEKEFLSALESKTGRIDALVNNAGHLIRKPFREVTRKEYNKIFDVNLFAPAELIRILLPMLKESELGHVVNVTSMGGFQGSSKFTGLSYYSASKAALANLTECLAEEFSPEGVHFNALALGAVQTEMLERAFPGINVPLNPEQMAAFIHWFILEGARFFNGKVLPVSSSTP